MAAGAATALKAGAAFAATGLGHAALTVASGTASTAAVIGGEALERKQRVEAISTTHRPEPMPETGNHTEARVRRSSSLLEADQTRQTEFSLLGYGHTEGTRRFQPRFLRSPSRENATNHDEETGRTKRSLLTLFTPAVNWVRSFFATTTGRVVKVVAKSGATATAAGGSLAAIDTIVRKHNEPENNLHVESANLQKPCWIPCNGITGFCAYCGANGRCCRIGYDIRGCDGEMGAPDEHVCVLPSKTDLEARTTKS